MAIHTTNAQVGIGTTSPDASAQLEVQSTTKGFLPPRMTEDDRDNISSPAQGLMIYCTNCGSNGEAQLYNGAAWVNMTGGTAAAVQPPQVGDFRDGGVVFYVATTPTDLNGDGILDVGLICAIVDQSAAVQWFNGVHTTTGATATDIGVGKTNTTAIISNQGTGTYAASICNDYAVSIDGTTYSDWFLPSKDELDLMNQNKITINNTSVENGGNSFASEFHWSSSENTPNHTAWGQNFNLDNQNGGANKGVLGRVRAIRAF
ncbi:hypothetical protein GCM10010832_26510 [Psychroflexus planctonicus]|uniref:DUF1566 domain-containing protein n=2 Tax=Psychroflexus planctonicus TaxID=1526575 RepID=A0ABQ1SPQ6_9FLAO|nr:hypothetical protein GCM10010832_26510 [Psychroflexus planctonicus]